MTLAKEPGIVADKQPGTQLAYIAFNFNDPILARREVRQAFAYATDRGSLIRYLLRGQARPASNLLPPNHWAYEPDVASTHTIRRGRRNYSTRPGFRKDQTACVSTSS